MVLNARNTYNRQKETEQFFLHLTLTFKGKKIIEGRALGHRVWKVGNVSRSNAKLIFLRASGQQGLNKANRKLLSKEFRL